MNISTYEARIKALEDQLNPPSPGGSTGLLSVTVDPDITLSDGTSLNAKLEENMPMAIGDSEKLEVSIITSSVPSGTQFSITATPAENSIAMVRDSNQGTAEAGERGDAVTISVVRGDDAAQAINFVAGAAETYPPESVEDTCNISVKVAMIGA